MGDFQKAFLFNGIGTRPEKLWKDMPKNLRERVEAYQEKVFQRYHLSMEIEQQMPENRMISEWLLSSICDRVIFEYYLEQNIIPDIGAGYSSGIVAISACFSAIDFDFSYDLIYRNKKVMEFIRNKNGQYDMGVIIGIEPEVVEEMIHILGYTTEVRIGSVNSIICVMITGEAEAVRTVLDYALTEGAIRANSLGTGVAFHHPVMQEYAQDYFELCKQGKYMDPKYPIMSIFNQSVMRTKEEILHENLINVVTPIYWEKTIDSLQEMGVTEFFDISASGASQKISRVNRKQAKIYRYLDI